MIEIENVQEIGAGTAIVGLVIAFMLYNKINKIEISNPIVADITQQIQNGAMAFLNAEYRYLAIFIAVVAAALYANPTTEPQTAIAFLAGAAASVAAGFSGMRAATSANGRTAMAAAEGGQPAALAVSYNGGAVMGLSVGGLGLLGISVMAMWLGTGEAIQNVAGFGMGASSIALFARVGGGIYTKAADVGADLVGKVEAGIPEDDPRNPAVIADNVGDNVGDVAGMGADLFESYVGSIIASIPAILTAMVQPDLGFGVGAVVAFGYVVINTLYGSIIEPQLMGRRLGLSPLVVFVSLAFWFWVWGPLGGLLSVPLTIVVRLVLERSEEYHRVRPSSSSSSHRARASPSPASSPSSPRSISWPSRPTRTAGS